MFEGYEKLLDKYEARIRKLTAALEWYANGNHMGSIENVHTGQTEFFVADIGTYARRVLDSVMEKK